jgi:hypothetical protein
MGSDNEARTSSQCQGSGEISEPNVENWVPLSVREARRARERRDELWPYVWMNFASILILAATLAIVSYRMAAQSCH